MKTKKYEVPTLYNISGSAHFYNKTHNGICIYRDFEAKKVDVYVQKVKWSWLGQTGWSSYSFDTETRQYGFLESSVIKKAYTPPNEFDNYQDAEFTPPAYDDNLLPF
jgi:hypothetical protein